MTGNSEDIAIKTTWFSIVGNSVLAIVKGLAGIFGHSYALIADAIESTTDVFSSLLILFGLKISNKPPDKNHPYGHGKIEPLVTFIVGAFLVVSATIISYESIENILTPHKNPKSWTLILLAVIILAKEISYRVVSRRSRETHSTSLKADAWHHRSDEITSIIAFIGISVAVIAGPGYETADDWAALAAAAFILYNSYLIFRPAWGEIMDEHFYDDLVGEIREVSATVEGVRGTEKCHIRKAGMKYHVDLHVRVDGDLTVTQGHQIAHQLIGALKLQLPQLEQILVHIEPHVP